MDRPEISGVDKLAIINQGYDSQPPEGVLRNWKVSKVIDHIRNGGLAISFGGVIFPYDNHLSGFHFRTPSFDFPTQMKITREGNGDEYFSIVPFNISCDEPEKDRPFSFNLSKGWRVGTGENGSEVHVSFLDSSQNYSCMTFHLKYASRGLGELSVALLDRLSKGEIHKTFFSQVAETYGLEIEGRSNQRTEGAVYETREFVAKNGKTFEMTIQRRLSDPFRERGIVVGSQDPEVYEKFGKNLASFGYKNYENEFEIIPGTHQIKTLDSMIETIN